MKAVRSTVQEAIVLRHARLNVELLDGMICKISNDCRRHESLRCSHASHLHTNLILDSECQSWFVARLTDQIMCNPKHVQSRVRRQLLVGLFTRASPTSRRPAQAKANSLLPKASNHRLHSSLSFSFLFTSSFLRAQSSYTHCIASWCLLGVSHLDWLLSTRCVSLFTPPIVVNADFK